MKLKLTFLLIFCLGMQIAFAQGKVVTGTVTSADDGNTIIGVSVMVTGTTNGVITDLNGNYKLTLPDNNAILKFSFIGFKSQLITVGQASTLNVVLERDVVDLEQVVVIGYGTSTKEALTGSVSIVGSKKLEMLPTATLQNALQGGVSGLMMNNSDGQPGAGAEIRIRGIGSISASSEPLYVIDGIPVQSGSSSPTGFSNDGASSSIMSTLNPNDIESISILKDASATAIYGSRGANGVIIITTKAGKEGKAKINFSTSNGFSTNAFNHLQVPLNADQYKQLFIEGYTNKGESVATATARFDSWFPEAATTNTNWVDEIYRTGNTQQYNIDINGGANGISYFASAGYYNQQGVLIGTDFERFSSRLNIVAKLTKRLTITNNITLGQTTANGAEDGTAWNNPMHNAYMTAPQVPVYDQYGRYYGDHIVLGMNGNNPVGNLLQDKRWQKQTRILDNLTASYKIREDLTFKSAWSADLVGVNEFQYLNPRYGEAMLTKGRGLEGTENNLNWIGTQTLNYNKLFKKNHDFDALLGYEAQKFESRSVQAMAEGYPNETLTTLANAANAKLATSSGTSFSFASMFSRFSYNYAAKYYATASFRRDGSSRFGEDSRWGNFWSLGTSWRVNKEDFMRNIKWVNDLKLRASYGITGNASIGNFDAIALYSFGYAYDAIAGSAPTNIGNPLLTWEGQSTMDLGVDFFVFDRIRATINYFNRKNNDLLLNMPLSETTGFNGNLQNVGDMLNKGFEIEANAQIVKSNDFKWDLGFNITLMKNEVTRLNVPIIDGAQNHTEGHDYYEFYMWHWAGVNPANGQAQWYTDATKTVITENIAQTVPFFTGKSALPSSYGGANTNISYKGFSLSAQAVFVWDKWVYNNQSKGIESDGARAPRSTNLYAFENRWTTPGQEALFPQFVWGNVTKSNQTNSTRYLYDATYIRLRDLTFAYTFNKAVTERLKISSLKVFAQANNYLTWVRSNIDQYDPESGTNGNVNGTVPKTKSITMGVNVGF